MLVFVFSLTKKRRVFAAHTAHLVFVDLTLLLFATIVIPLMSFGMHFFHRLSQYEWCVLYVFKLTKPFRNWVIGRVWRRGQSAKKEKNTHTEHNATINLNSKNTKSILAGDTFFFLETKFFRRLFFAYLYVFLTHSLSLASFGGTFFSL